MKAQLKHPQKWLALLGLLCVLFVNSTFAQQRFIAKSKGEIYHDILGKYLKAYTVYELETKALSEYVISHSTDARFELQLGSESLQIALTMNDMRSIDYKAVAMSGSDEIPIGQSEEETYKGTVNGDLRNIARLSINKQSLEGLLQVGSKQLYLDRLSQFTHNPVDTFVVAYYAEDVLADTAATCGALATQKLQKRYAPILKSGTGPCFFVEIATDADYEYYLYFGSDVNLALRRIRHILNIVEGYYTSPYNVKFIIRYQQIWTNIVDPYSGTTVYDWLPQFQVWWDNNRTNINRDVTHLFSGQTPSNSFVGLAYNQSVCDASIYYGLSTNYAPISASTICLTAHELGHNFGASHDASCNGGNIMCPGVQSGTLTWSNQSLNEITGYIAGSGSCMEETFSANASLVGLNATYGYVKIIASNTISLNSGLGSFNFSNTGFGYIEAGNSIVLTPTNPNSQGFYAPEGSVVLMRISDVTTTCDQLSVQLPVSKAIQKGIVEEAANAGAFHIYPNPFTSTFDLTINSKNNTKAQVTIFNSVGVKVKTLPVINAAKGFNKITVDGSSFAKGIYMVEVRMGEEKIIKKVIKL